MKNLLVWLLCFVALPLGAQITDAWEELSDVGLAQHPESVCPTKFWWPFISESGGKVYIRTNVNKCRTLWNELDPSSGWMGPDFSPFPEAPGSGNGGFFGLAIPEGCYTTSNTYSNPGNAGLFCDGQPHYPGGFNAGVVGGWMTEIPEEHRARLGGTHLAARGFFNQRETYGSTIGPGAVVLDLGNPSEGYKLFWSPVVEIDPPVDDQDQYPGVGITRVADYRETGCTVVDDYVVCVGTKYVGDWYGVTYRYCRDDYDVNTNPNGECLPGSVPTPHPITGDPMDDPCVRALHKGRRSTGEYPAIWVVGLDGTLLEEKLLDRGCGTQSGELFGATFNEASRVLSVGFVRGNVNVLKQWRIPGGGNEWIDFTLEFRCYPGDDIEAYRNGELVAEVICE